MAETLAGRGGRLLNTAAPLWMRAVVVPAALRFEKAWPGVGLTFRSVPFAEGVRLLEAGDLHCGGVDGGGPLPEYLRREPLLTLTGGIVARRSHPFRSRWPTAEDLVRSPWMDCYASTPTGADARVRGDGARRRARGAALSGRAGRPGGVAGRPQPPSGAGIR